MKTIKKLFALAMALAMILSFALPVLAADEPKYTITINDANTGHTYQAYQIFDGDYHAATAVLANIKWGANFDKTKTNDFLLALKSEPSLKPAGTGTVNIFNGISAATAGNEDEVAVAIAGVLAKYEDDHTFAQAFAKVLHAKDTSDYLYLTGTPKESTTVGSGYQISDLPAGYYLVKDKDGTLNGENDYYTRLILHVTSNTSISPKGGVPTVGKTVHSAPDQTFKDFEDVSLTQPVYFKLEGTLPSNYAVYENYTYEFVDTMSSGLDLSDEIFADKQDDAHVFKGLYSIVVERKSGSVELSTTTNPADASNDPTDDKRLNLLVATSEADIVDATDLLITYNASTRQLTFKFLNLKKSLPNLIDSDKIVIKYAATLNENAVLGNGTDGNGNKNEVILNFSNNPQGDGTGTTPKADAKVFSFELDIHKVDEANNALPNAKFLIYERIPIGLTGKYTYNYAVFEYADGVYTLKDWLPMEGMIQHQSKDIPGSTLTENYAVNATGEKLYGKDDTYPSLSLKKDGTIGATGGTGLDGVILDSMIVTSPATGTIKIEGMDAVTYWAHEIEAPLPYNKLTEDSQIVISATYDDATDNIKTLTVTANGHEGTADIPTGTVTVSVKNTKGTTLPSTGGVGTTLFYVIGGMMAVAATTMLITKKRMHG